AAFLVIIPAVDTLVQRGWDLRRSWWIGLHALVAPIAFAFLELVVKPNTGGATTEGYEGEAVSHLGMLIFYVSRNDFSWETLYGFLVNWLFFSIAAPTIQTTFALRIWSEWTAYFAPVFANYFTSPVSGTVATLLGVVLVASLLQGARRRGDGGTAGL